MKKVIGSIIVAAFFCLTPTAGYSKTNKTGGNFIPVRIQFNAIILKNNGAISWKAIKLLHVLRYELEKSTDGENFSYVTALAGNNKINKSNYTAEDRNVTEGINYYRLKVISSQGAINYSKVITLEKKLTAAEITIMPGTITDELYIWLPANTQITNTIITDVAGREVRKNPSINHLTNVASLQLGRLPAGIYQINILTNSGKTALLKFSKK